LVRELTHAGRRTIPFWSAGLVAAQQRLLFGADALEGSDSRIENPAGRAGGDRS